MPYDDESKRILAKYGISYSDDGQAQRRETEAAPAASQSQGVDMRTLRNTRYDTESRRILAQYGLADYTQDEIDEMKRWSGIAKRGYGNLSGYVNQLGKTDWTALNYDKNYRQGLGQQIQEAQDYFKTLKKGSISYKDAKDYLDYLTGLQSAFKDREGYLANFKDEQDYKDWQASNDYFTRYAGMEGVSYNDIYQHAANDAAEVEKKVGEAKQLQERIGKMIQELQADMYYPETSGWASTGGKRLTSEQATARLQEFRRQYQLAGEEVQKAEDELRSAQRVSAYARARRYEDLPDMPDWNEKIRQGREAYEGYENPGYSPNVMATDPLAMAFDQWLQSKENEAAEMERPKTGTDQGWTEDELNTYFYLNADNKEAAADYAWNLNAARRLRDLEAQQKKIADWTNESGWNRAAAWGAGVLSMPFQTADYLDAALGYAVSGRIAPHENMTPADYANTMTGAAAQYLNENYETIGENVPIIGGAGWGDVYQLSQSIAQSALAASMGGGTANLLFFGSAANQGLADAKARGASDGEALVLGFLNGAAEVLGETFSVEKLIAIKNPATFRRYLWNVVKQGGVEASEEAVTTVLNTFADAIVMGDKSELNTKIRDLMAQGMSRAEAERTAWLEWTEGVAYDALGGLLSGGISAAGRQGIGMLRSNSFAYSGADAEQLVEAGLQKDKNSAAYKLAQQIQEQGTMSELEAQRLTDLLGEDAEAIHRNQRAELKQEAQRRLQESGVGQRSAARMAETITRDLLGEELDRTGKADRERDFQNPTVRTVAEQLRQERRLESISRWQQAQANRSEKKTAANISEQLKKAFTASNLEISDKDLEILQEGYGGGQRMNAYVIAMRDGYRLGKVGMDYEKAAAASEYSRKVLPLQFQHAWELGMKAAGREIPSSMRGQTAELGSAEKTGSVTLRGQEGAYQIQSLQRNEAGELQATVKAADGSEQTVSVQSLDFADSGMGDLVQVLRDRPDAEQMFRAYRSGTNIGSFVRAWDTAKAYGQATGSRTVESVLQDSMLKGMDEETIRAAFAYGRSLKEQEKAARAEREKTPSVSSADSSPSGGAKGDTSSALRAPSPQGEGLRGEGKGGVSYDGGTVGSIQLKAVNKNKLTPRQRAQIRVVEALGKKFGIKFVLFQSEMKNGRYKGFNGLEQNGVIYLDVNAGMYGRSMGQVAIVRTAAHELTHYMREFNEERYEELQEYLLDNLAEWKGKDLGQLVAQKMARDSTGKLTPEGALEEVVADGCEMMLSRTKVLQTMAEEKPGLFNAIKDWLQNYVETVKEAFQGVSAVHEEARAVESWEQEKLDKFVDLWYKGLTEAAERAAKSPASEGGAVRYSSRERILDLDIPWDNDNNSSIKTQLSRVTHRIAGYDPVTSVEYDKNKQYYTDQLSDILRTRFGGGEIERQDGISFLFDKESVATVRHYVGSDAEAAAAIAAPYVLKRGEIISGHKNHNNNGYPSLTFAASVELNGKKGVEAVVVLFAGKDRVHSLRITTLDGKEFVLDVKKKSDSEMEGAAEKAAVARPTGSDSGTSILSSSENSNTKFQEREELPDDRALLMQARAEGRNAESLTAYQKKVKALETLERKLRRQQDALEAARKHEAVDEKGEPLPPEEQKKFNREAVKGVQEQIRKTEASIRRAEQALADMERKPELRQELEKSLARWREQNPNDAAKAIREMQQERDSLREYVKLLRQEATLTTPEERKVLPSDVQKLARSLVKEHGSAAAVDQIAAMLQDMGDFMVSNLEGGGTGYYNALVNKAKQIAKAIIDESYETIDENKEVREGIRAYLREHTLRISDDVKGDIPDFERWRKAHMGTLRMGKEGMDIDQAYQDLRSSYGEGFFPADVLSHSDQLQQILDTLEAVQPTYQQMFSQFESWQAAESFANEIIDRMLSGEVREKESMADQAFRRRMEQLEKKYERKDRARQKALENAEDRAAWEARKRDEAEERRLEERALRRQLVAEKVHELRERSIERDRKYRARIAIDKKVVALSKIMLENSGKRHVPDAWKETIGNFLASIDTLTQHTREEGRAIYLERIEALQEMVRKQQLANEGREERGEEQGPQVYFDILPYIADKLKPFVALARDSSTGTIQVENLEVEQMKELEEVLTAIREAVDKADVMLAAAEKGETLSKTGGETIDYLESQGKGKTGGMLRRFLSWDNLTPVYFFKRLGPAAERVFRELQRGWGKLAMNVRQIIDFSNATYTAKEARDWEQEVHEFQLIRRESDLSGRESLTKAAAEGGAEAAKAAEERNKETVKLSTAQIMGLYCLVKREQALGHILGGGIRIWDITQKPTLKNKLKGETVQEQAERYLVNQKDIAEITGALTARQKEVADALQRYMNTVGSAWGNEVSQARYGVDLFGEQNYYPIQTDPMSRNARNPDADGADLFHLLNMGFTKNTVKNAKNGIVLHSIFDVFSNHMADMAKYNAMGLPMLDAMKWINYLDETDGKFTSVRKAMEHAYGKNAEKYFLGLIQDLNGNFEGGRRGEDIASKMISFSKVASVGANLRVAALQPTSYVRALAVLDPKYLLKGDNPTKIRQGIREALQYSGTAVWKDLGFFDINVNANMRDMIKHTDGALEKIREGSMAGAEMGDKTTWGRLWNATKAEVQDKTGLTGEALLKATAERFDDVIYQTQVMDSTMTRSHLMRQKGAFASMVTSFMSEPTLSYNLLLDAVSNWKQTKRSGKAVKQASLFAARAFTVYAVSQVITSIVESIFDAMRDEDDYENFWEKWKQAEFGWDGNLIQDLAPWNKLPFLRDAVSIIQGFSNKRMDTEWMEYWMQAINAVIKDFKDGDFRWGTAFKAMRALSTVTGLPVANTARDAIALWNTFVVQSVPDWKLKTVKRSTVTPTASIKQAFQAGALSEEDAIRYLMRDAEIETEEKARQKVFEWSLEKGTKKYDKLLNAVYGGKDSKAAREELLKAGFSEDSLRSEVRSAVKAWYQGTAEDGRPRIEKDAAIRMLVKEGGMSQRDAEAKVREWSSYVSSPETLQYEDIQDAYIAGEITAARAAEMRMLYGGKSKSEAQAEVQQWTCEKDTGIAYKDLKDAWIDGEISDSEAVEYQMKYGGQTKVNAEKTLQKWRYVKDTGGDYNDVKQGFLEGSISEQDAIDARVTYGGQTKIDAQKEIRKWTCEKETGIDYDDMHDLYLSGELSAERAAQLRMTYGGQTKTDAQKEVRKWTCEKETGIVYDDLQDLYLSGEVSAERASQLRVTYGGQTKIDADSEVLKWRCEKETGIRYSEMEKLLIGGELSGSRAADLRVKYGGQSKEKAEEEVLHWQCEKDTGIRYKDIRDAYAGGQITADKAQKMLEKYGGYDEKDAEAKVLQYKFAGTNADLADITPSAATTWYGSLESQGISKEIWYKTWRTNSTTTADKYANGKTISGSKKNKMVAYINGLNLTPAQKDALYLALDYAKSGLRATPWH